MTDLVTLTIDGFSVSVPKGTLIIRAAELLGIQIPRFCDHPLLDPAANCRQCLVDIPDAGNGRGFPKPQPSCAIEVAEGMVVATQLTSAVAEKAQRGAMELLLMNHPLDCPVCDKGGECPLQNQAMSNGQGESRFHEHKRTFPKPLPLSTEVLLDRERCIQCARCIRFSEQIAGDPLIEFFERGAKEQVRVADGQPFDSYFSGNTIQICPVGALTGAAYRFRARPFDLVSTPSVCEHCAAGCVQRTDHRRGRVTRRLAGNEPLVNEEWNCDKGRWAFTYAQQPDRLRTPLIRNEDGVLVPASWPEALSVAAEGLAKARGKAGVLTGGRLTVEDAYAYAKFARLALGTNDIDFRARPHSAEETQFLAHAVAGKGIDVSYSDLEQAPAVVLVGFEPEDESPIVFLRLRKAWKKSGLKVTSIAPFASKGLAKMGGTLVPTAPGAEAEAIGDLVGNLAEGTVVLAGERLATVPGALSALVRLGASSGAKIAWIPRRAGERGAIEAGALPNVLPIGRPVDDESARAEIARVWNVSSLPVTPGRDTDGILAAALNEELEALVIAGVDPYDLADPAAVLAALENTRSSSAWRSAPAPSPTAPTWCCRSRPCRRSPARSSTGKAAAARSRRPSRCPASRATWRSSPTWPTRWTSTWACPTPRRPAANWAPSAPGAAATWRHRASTAARRARRRRVRHCCRPGTSSSTTAACRTASRTWPAPPARPRRWSPRRRRPRSVSPTATSWWSAATSRCPSASPRCPTGWSGCRRTPAAARSRVT